MTNIRNDIAGIIREVDGDNRMSPLALGATIASRLIAVRGDVYAAEVIAFVERFNHDKVLSAGALADAIVDEFNLDEEPTRP